jgi:hypothetical protein
MKQLWVSEKSQVTKILDKIWKNEKPRWFNNNTDTLIYDEF